MALLRTSLNGGSFDGTLSKLSTSQFVSSDAFADILKVDSVPTVAPFPVPSLAPVTTKESTPVLSQTSATTTTTTQQKGLLDYLKDIGSNILNTFKTQATATVQGAVEGAAASTAGAAAGARVGASATGISLPVLLVVVIGLLLLLRR